MNLPSSLALFGYVQRKFGRKELARSQNRNHNEAEKVMSPSGRLNFRNTPSREGDRTGEDNEERYICRVNNLAESGVVRHST